jgi:hypothetical protein
MNDQSIAIGQRERWYVGKCKNMIRRTEPENVRAGTWLDSNEVHKLTSLVLCQPETLPGNTTWHIWNCRNTIGFPLSTYLLVTAHKQSWGSGGCQEISTLDHAHNRLRILILPSFRLIIVFAYRNCLSQGLWPWEGSEYVGPRTATSCIPFLPERCPPCKPVCLFRSVSVLCFGSS